MTAAHAARRGAVPLAAVGVPLGAYAASRVLTFLAAGVASQLRPGLSTLAVFGMWDGAWYVEAIKNGYPPDLAVTDGHIGQSTHAFFPLFPALARAADTVLPIGPLGAGVLVALVFGAIATVLVWHLADRTVGREAADRTAVLFSFFPGAYVLSMVYAEAVMLACASACLLALLQRRWAVAGVTGLLTTASRPNGLAVAASAAWAAFDAIRERREWRSLIAPVLAPLGALAFLGFLWARTDTATAWFDVQREGWGERVDFGRASVDLFFDFVADPFTGFNTFISALGLIFIAFGLVLLVRSDLPMPLKIYAYVIAALAFFTKTLTARPRFILSAFPLLIVIAARLRGWVFQALVGACAAGMVLLIVLHTFPEPLVRAP